MEIENVPDLSVITSVDGTMKDIIVSKGCETLEAVNLQNNRIEVLDLDGCPNLENVEAGENKLMWLDMDHVVVDESHSSHVFVVDEQNPEVVAVKISPTEVGLKIHDRLDVSRVLDMKTKGAAFSPKEITVDDIRYMVIYDNGPQVASLVGADNSYWYETKWPYAWQDGNTKDNNLPVTLHVTSWTKHPSWIKFASTTTLQGEVGKPAPVLPALLRSQDYDGKVTYSSSNENVLKIDPNTGVITVVAEGTAYIYATGVETDYRLAPSSITIKVEIAQEAAGIETVESESVNSEQKVYTIGGQRININTAKSGVYIVNGKKVLIK